MASKLNSEFNYRYLVEGETVWAKIKTLKNFLEGRERAAALEKVAAMKLEAKKMEIQNAKRIGALPHVILNLEAELLEIESFQPAQDHGFELNKEEINILRKLLDEAYAIAEPTRIPGYSDEQMFEANAANEFTMQIAKDIQAEIIANGRPSPAKLRNAMSNPYTFKALLQAGIIPEGTKRLICNNDPQRIELKTEQPPSLTDTNS